MVGRARAHLDTLPPCCMYSKVANRATTIIKATKQLATAAKEKRSVGACSMDLRYCLAHAYDSSYFRCF